jgi:hypothetical protein
VADPPPAQSFNSPASCGDNASTYTVPDGASAVDIVAAGGQGGTGMVAGNEDSDASVGVAVP